MTAVDSDGGLAALGAIGMCELHGGSFRLSIDPRATIPDHFGRSMFLLDKGEPMRELY